LLEELIGQVLELAAAVSWAVDMHSSESALLVALLLTHEQTVVYVPGVMVPVDPHAVAGLALSSEGIRHRRTVSPVFVLAAVNEARGRRASSRRSRSASPTWSSRSRNAGVQLKPLNV
jgi:hypothetical protein